MTLNPHITIVTPVFGCDQVLVELYQRLCSSLSTITERFEIIMVNDASPDCAWDLIQKLAQNDPRVKGINLSRNFGQHHAITAGLDFAQGDWVVVMDCDLQDQPEEIPKLYFKALEGYDLVVGLRTQRQDNLLRKLISKLFFVVVEEFIEGTRHGLSTFIRDGRVVFYFHDNEHYYKNPYMVAAASTPADVPRAVITNLCQTAEKIAGLLQLKTGIFHIQYILHQDEPVIIEICRRSPGDLYIKFVQHATGVDYPSFIVRAAAGMSCDDLQPVEPQGYFTRHCVMPPHNGKIKSLVIDESVQTNVIDKFMWWQPGTEVNYFLIHKLGIMFLEFDSMTEMLNKTENMPSLIRVEMV